MKPLPDSTAREIGGALCEVEMALKACRTLIIAPAGHSPEQLEDNLNWLQDASYRARRAFRVEAVR